MTDQDVLIKKIEFIIDDFIFAKSYQKNNSVSHFVALRKCVREGKKLTKKMKKNLQWIEKNVEML